MRELCNAGFRLTKQLAPVRGVGCIPFAGRGQHRPQLRIIHLPELAYIAPLSTSTAHQGAPSPRNVIMSPHQPQRFGQMELYDRGETTIWRTCKLSLWHATEPQLF